MEHQPDQFCGSQKPIEDCATAQAVIDDVLGRQDRSRRVRHRPVPDWIDARELRSYQKRCQDCGKVCLPALLPNGSVQFFFNDERKGEPQADMTPNSPSS